MYKIIIGENSFNINIKGEAIELDGKASKLDLSHLGANRYHLLLHHKSYNIEILYFNKSSGEVGIKVNNLQETVLVKTALDELLTQMGLTENNAPLTNDVCAPMPGLILDVVVAEGDEVKAGDKLFVLEAMKMENIIKSPNNGKIKSVIIAKGDSVNSGQKLIHFE